MTVKKRGFATMTQEKRKIIASMGGKAAHQKGNAHQWTSEEAKKAATLSVKSKAQKQQQDS